MLDDGDKQKARCWRALNRWRRRRSPGRTAGKSEYRDRKTGNGPVGFSASMLPFYRMTTPAIQRQRVADNYPGADA
jgi:endoglucanase